jgi:hypothetical protein
LTSSYCQWSPEMSVPEHLRFPLIPEIHPFFASQTSVNPKVVETLQKPSLWSLSWRWTEDQHCVGTKWNLVAH